MLYHDDMHPFRSGITALITFAGACFLIGLLLIGGWEAGWWFRTQDTNRQTQLDQQGIGYQQSLQAQISDDMGLITNLNPQIIVNGGDPSLIGTLVAERKAAVIRVCQRAPQINPSTSLPPDEASFVISNCYAGSISPSSPYN